MVHCVAGAVCYGSLIRRPNEEPPDDGETEDVEIGAEEDGDDGADDDQMIISE